MNLRLLSLSAAMLCIGHSSIAQKHHELTAASVWQYDPANALFDPTDSTTYAHSSGRNSPAVTYDDRFYAWDSLKYDNADIYKYVGGKYEHYQRRSMMFDANGMKQEHLRQGVNGQSLQDNDREQHSYTQVNGKQVLSQTIYQIYKNNSWANSYRQSYSYDNLGRYSQGVGDSWSGSAWTHTRRDTTWYDGKGNIARKVDWLVANQAPIPQMDMRYVYDVNDRLTSDTSYSFFEVVSAGTYVYDAQGRVNIHTVTNRNAVANVWTPSAQLHYTYDAQGNKLMMMYKQWDAAAAAFVNMHVTDYGYTAGGQLKTIYGPIHWDGSQFAVQKAGTTRETFYYSMFPLSVADKDGAALQLSVYPSPAVSNINISLKLATAQDISACVISSDGRMVRQWADAKTQQYSKSVSVRDMPAGTYHLIVMAGSNKLSKTFTVVK